MKLKDKIIGLPKIGFVFDVVVGLAIKRLQCFHQAGIFVSNNPDLIDKVFIRLQFDLIDLDFTDGLIIRMIDFVKFRWILISLLKLFLKFITLN